MNTGYFDEYIHYKNTGIKSKAKELIRKFIDSFENYAEKEQWTVEYLPKLEMDSNGRIRNELFEEIIFPVLLNGYNNRNTFLMIWLAKLKQNYYQNAGVWKKMNYKTEVEIIRECYELEPDNNDVTDLFLEIMIDRMDFNMHELPEGILFGNSFATKDECKILLERIEFMNKLDRNKKYSEYLCDCREKITEYMELRTKSWLSCPDI
ncbi:MAG: hypothetical protein LBK58_01840 [Prevotellaceae bacterium]|nr:hypothetical protein [Prevotellaceae bacterium]